MLCVVALPGCVTAMVCARVRMWPTCTRMCACVLVCVVRSMCILCACMIVCACVQVVRVCKEEEVDGRAHQRDPQSKHARSKHVKRPKLLEKDTPCDHSIHCYCSLHPDASTQLSDESKELGMGGGQAGMGCGMGSDGYVT